MNDSKVIYETSCGSVTILSYGNRLRILYGNVVIDQTYKEFEYFLRMINSLYKYILDVRQLYYRKFLIKVKEYSMSLSLNSHEIVEMYELLGGADTMMTLNRIVKEALDTPSEGGKYN